MLRSKSEYRKLFKFWKEKKYYTASDNFATWLAWAYSWDESFREEQFKEYEESKVNRLDCIPCKAPAAVPNVTFERKDWVILDDIVVQQEPKAKAMNTDTRTEAQQAKDYLIESLRDATYNKEQETRKAFHIDERPIVTLGELRKAVKDGWFNVDKSMKDYGDDFPVYGVWDFITIENPEKKQDREGYDAARKEIRKAASDVKDQIVVFGPEKGLEALNAFKAQSFHS